MAGNPLVAQGTINRLRASIQWPLRPALNITASYLAKSGIRISWEGEATTIIPTMVGTIQSPVPYMLANVSIPLLRSQALANAYKLQMEQDSNMGDGIIRPDAAPLSPFPIYNAAIQNVGELNFSGDNADYGVTVKGYWPVNNSLWNF